MQAYRRRIARIHRELGIPDDYSVRYGLAIQPETMDRVSIGPDIYGRDQQLTAAAFDAWRRMCAAAAGGNIDLQVVSAFRSVDKQVAIVRGKLDRGASIEDILRVSAAPGYSEHHAGRALDVTEPGCEPLTEGFERTDAFGWLCENAASFGFYMSYPRGNLSGVTYEPWHWAFTGE